MKQVRRGRRSEEFGMHRGEVSAERRSTFAPEPKTGQAQRGWWVRGVRVGGLREVGPFSGLYYIGYSNVDWPDSISCGLVLMAAVFFNHHVRGYEPIQYIEGRSSTPHRD